MKVLDKLLEISETLNQHPIEDAMKEAEFIVSHVTRFERSKIFLNDHELTVDEISLIDNAVRKRLQGNPLQYIIGEVSFFDLQIKVGEGVLIPRPETEYMVEVAIDVIREKNFSDLSNLLILDLCTGSGCIALALGSYFSNALILGIDISPLALSFANVNRSINGISNVEFVAGDLFSPLREGRFHLIISNPPYIATEDIKNLQIEIKEYEPLIALDGGIRGVDFYDRIFSEAMNYLKKDGLLILEIGYGQSEILRVMAEGKGYRDIYFINDLAGIERILVAGVK